MSVKLRNINTWRRMGDSLPLPGGKRLVTVEFNVEAVTTLRVLQDGQATLLRTVSPDSCPLPISFSVDGDCSIIHDGGGEVWWRSDDGAIYSYEVLEESFTSLEQRLEMTSEMEVILLKADVRKAQRLAEQAQQRAIVAERKAAKEAREKEAQDNGKKPDPVDGGKRGEKKAAGSAHAPEQAGAGDDNAP